MKIKGKGLCCVLAGGLLVVPKLHAQNLTNVAGTWNGVYFNIPSQLTSVTSQGLVTDIPQSSSFGAGTFQVIMAPNGTFSGPDGTGTISVAGQGMLTVDPDDGSPVYFRANFAQDVFAGLANESDGPHPENALNLAVRAPATLTTNDIAGTWTIMSFATPQRLIEVFAPTTNGSALTDVLGFDSNSIPNSSFSEIATGTMTFSPSGTLSGNMEGPFTGTFSLVSTGQVNIAVDTGEGILGLNLFINASKDTMVCMNLEGGGNRQEMLVFTKSPVALTLPDLQGVWKVTSFHAPAGIALNRNSSNFVTAVIPSEQPEMNQTGFVVGHDGFMTAVFDGESVIGAATIGGGGLITVTFTNSANEVESHSGIINAGKDCITFVESQGVSKEINVVTKAPNFPGASGQDVGLLFFNGTICWASGTNRVLQAASTLSGSWTNLSATQGLHGYQPVFTNGSGFFRVQAQ